METSKRAAPRYRTCGPERQRGRHDAGPAQRFVSSSRLGGRRRLRTSAAVSPATSANRPKASSADAEPEAGSGTTVRSAGGGTRQRRRTAGLVVAEQVAERGLLGRSRSRRVPDATRDERDGLAAGAGAVANVWRGRGLSRRAGEHLLSRGRRHVARRAAAAGVVARRRGGAAARTRGGFVALSGGRGLAAGDARRLELRGAVFAAAAAAPEAAQRVLG